MNPPRSTYRSDYGSLPWMENNLNSQSFEFCSSDNIDECLKYISLELSALGYPSIYTTPNSCPNAVNCDIIKLLNVLYELVKISRDHAEIREELEARNQRLVSDVNALNRKNNQLKECLEQSERRYNSVLEKERQLKNKNDHLQHQIKNEKDELKKLSSLLQHQKSTYQHEIRKYEARLNQMKSRLSQILADKNPDKKIANISTSHLLQRNSNQRGKWKTEPVAKNSCEEMFNSVIQNCENRYQAALQEKYQICSCLEETELKILEIISLFEDDAYKKSFIPLKAILNRSDFYQELRERFRLILSSLKENVLNKLLTNVSNQDCATSLKSALVENENVSKCEEFNKVEKSSILYNKENILHCPNCKSQKELMDCQEKLCREKEALSSISSEIKEEMSKLETQKLEMIKFAIKPKICNQLQNSKSVPSFSVLTRKDGLTAVPANHQLKQCLSSPDEFINTMPPLWAVKSEKNSKSNSPVPSIDGLGCSSKGIPKNDIADNDLPKWARIVSPLSEVHLLNEEISPFLNKSTDVVVQNNSEEELETSELISCEDNFEKLRAAMEDIENRRKNSFDK